MKKKILLFDVDGTLVDSYPTYAGLMQEILPQFGIEPTATQLKRGFTMTIEQEIEYFQLPPAGLHEWFAAYDQAASRRKNQPETYPQIDRMFEYLTTQRNLKLGVVTSRSREDVADNLPSFWWYSHMTVVVTADDTKFPKPAGAPLEYALAQYGCQPEEALYIGDADTDEAAAFNAGVEFAGALWGSGETQNFKQQPLLLRRPLDVKSLV